MNTLVKKEDFVMNLSKNLCKAYGVDFNAFPIQKKLDK